MDEPADLRPRLAAVASRFLALRLAVLDREPWPLSPVFGHENEAVWGPPEILAHVTEMLPYWLGEIERVLAGSPDPVPFGRVATDPVRIAIIGRDRSVPLRELFDRVESDVARYDRRIGELMPADLLREGLHPVRGPMPVAVMFDRFVIDHLGEHADQLRRLLDSSA